MDVRPLHDRIIVQRLEDDAPKAGAIIIPDSAKEKPQRGTVIAAGTGSSRTTAPGCPWISRRATPFSSASSPVRKSSSTASTT